MNAAKTRKKPVLLLVEETDFMFGFLEWERKKLPKETFDIVRVKYPWDALEFIKKGEEFDAVIFNFNRWWSEAFEVAYELRQLDNNLLIIAFLCHDYCFDKEQCREMGVHVFPDRGLATRLHDIENALDEVGVLKS